MASGYFQPNQTNVGSVVTGQGFVTTSGLSLFATPDWINVRYFGADPTGVRDSTNAFLAAVASIPAIGGTIYCPAGTYLIASQITFNKARSFVIGDGKNLTIWKWTGAAGTMFSFDNGASPLFQCGFYGGNFIATADTTNTKTALLLKDVSEFYLGSVATIIGGWTGSNSIGVKMQGREVVVMDRLDLECDIGVSIEANPNAASLCFDSCTIKDSVIGGGTATTGVPILIAPGANITRSDFKNIALIKGRNGVEFLSDGTNANACFDMRKSVV